MKVAGYVMLGDPTWLATSVSSYYPFLSRLVVSYDSSGLGWNGVPIEVDRCRSVIDAIDPEGKVTYLPGKFSASAVGSRDLVDLDTAQRRAALAEAGDGMDWVVQIDTDEVLPNWPALLSVLEAASARGVDAVEWPMRILYRKLRRGGHLEVVNADGSTHYEYPGPIAVRPGVRLVECRRTDGAFLRPLVVGDVSSLQVRRPPSDGEVRAQLVSPDDVIWHNSWARSPRVVRRKVASWSHNRGARSWFNYYCVWKPSPMRWKGMRDVHPLYAPLWPRLAIAPSLPFAVNTLDQE